MKPYVLVLTLLLVACGGGDTAPNVGAVNIDCADAFNEGDTNECEQVASASVSTGLRFVTGVDTRIIDLGDISRSELVNVSMLVKNDTAEPYNGHYEVILDVDCNAGTGAPWVVAPIQPFPEVAPSASESVGIGASCDGADLGPTTMSFTLYDDVQKEVMRDQVVAEVNLVN